VLLMEPSPTPYDLRFGMFGVPVRVHPMFWLVSVIMGASPFREGVQFLLLWVGCMFVSILVHELGHVLMGQAFGAYGHIVLYGFGGLAIGSNQLQVRWHRIAVCFAGPLAGFVFLGGLFVALWFWDPESFSFYMLLAKEDLGLPIGMLAPLEAGQAMPHPLLSAAADYLIFINLLWGLVNLLPIWPLDGGQISRDVCEGISPAHGLKQSLGLSLAVAGLLAVQCFMTMMGRPLLPWHVGSGYAALLFGVLALQSFQLLQQANRPWREERWRDDDDYER
jgi:stage IV sporulation protein FB